MERITRRKMAKQPLDRKVKRLRSWFRYRGDYLPYSTSFSTTVKQCLDEMEYMQQATGYYLTWEVKWEDEKK